MMTVFTLEMSAAQTTAPTGSMIGATLTALPSMITMSAFLPGVSETGPIVDPGDLRAAEGRPRSTWREVIKAGGRSPSRSRPRPPGAGAHARSAKTACIWVN